MLAKLTSRNRLTIPRRIVDAVGGVEYVDVELRGRQVVLTPVRIQRGDAVRAKLAALGHGEADAVDAVRWARAGDAAGAITKPMSGHGRVRGGVGRTPSR